MRHQVLNGIDNLDEIKKALGDKKVGLITSPSGINKDFKYTIDVFNENFNLVALFSPEHGIRGNLQAGEEVGTYTDERTGIKVYSLYGENKKPSKEMLEGIDVLVFDIGDVGSRFYTYIYSMGYCLEACKENNKKLLVLDRINILGGEKVEGNILEEEFKTFVGMYPIPIRYGLTIGELAHYFNNEFNIGCDLEVIKIKEWERWMLYEDTDLPWISPSPNMPSLSTSLLYNGTCLLEGTNISEGRGTTKPFEIVGAPWIDGYKLAEIMEEKNIKGVRFRPIYYTPTFSKHEGKMCGGVQIHITDTREVNGVEVGLHLLEVIIKMDKGDLQFIESEGYGIFLDSISGTKILRESLGKELSAKDILEKWNTETQSFREKASKYYLYK
ncbi:exo-beta-N-acetylmuramidase NamZ family protein [Clostridium hydrogeniformans]|uniref:exo-beta-N-acetylmuramidase NamZ family protein n=1 Tax=Clostridium hydrogeniformans TaxID=349933 RepID=UPI0005584AA2|nr:DUF1343 domain-containing protein [Clostridium hydrogeniformans]